MYSDAMAVAVNNPFWGYQGPSIQQAPANTGSQYIINEVTTVRSTVFTSRTSDYIHQQPRTEQEMLIMQQAGPSGSSWGGGRIIQNPPPYAQAIQSEVRQNNNVNSYNNVNGYVNNVNSNVNNSSVNSVGQMYRSNQQVPVSAGRSQTSSVGATNSQRQKIRVMGVEAINSLNLNQIQYQLRERTRNEDELELLCQETISGILKDAETIAASNIPTPQQLQMLSNNQQLPRHQEAQPLQPNVQQQRPEQIIPPQRMTVQQQEQPILQQMEQHFGSQQVPQQQQEQQEAMRQQEFLQEQLRQQLHYQQVTQRLHQQRMQQMQQQQLQKLQMQQQQVQKQQMQQQQQAQQHIYSPQLQNQQRQNQNSKPPRPQKATNSQKLPQQRQQTPQPQPRQQTPQLQPRQQTPQPQPRQQTPQPQPRQQPPQPQQPQPQQYFQVHLESLGEKLKSALVAGNSVQQQVPIQSVPHIQSNNNPRSSPIQINQTSKAQSNFIQINSTTNANLPNNVTVIPTQTVSGTHKLPGMVQGPARSMPTILARNRGTGTQQPPFYTNSTTIRQSNGTVIRQPTPPQTLAASTISTPPTETIANRTVNGNPASSVNDLRSEVSPFLTFNSLNVTSIHEEFRKKEERSKQNGNPNNTYILTEGRMEKLATEELLELDTLRKHQIETQKKSETEAAVNGVSSFCDIESSNVSSLGNSVEINLIEPGKHVQRKRPGPRSKTDLEYMKFLEEQKRLQILKAAEENQRIMAIIAEQKRVEALKIAEEEKMKQEAMKALEELKRRQEALKAAEEEKKKQEELKAAEELKRKQEALKAAEEEKKMQEALKAAEELKKKVEALKNVEELPKKLEALKAAEEEKRRQEALKAAEEEQRKQEALKAAEEEKKMQEALKAAEELKKKAEAWKAAEEERKKQEALKAAEEEKKKQEMLKAAEEEKKKHEALKAAEEKRKEEAMKTSKKHTIPVVKTVEIVSKPSCSSATIEKTEKSSDVKNKLKNSTPAKIDTSVIDEKAEKSKEVKNHQETVTKPENSPAKAKPVESAKETNNTTAKDKDTSDSEFQAKINRLKLQKIKQYCEEPRSSKKRRSTDDESSSEDDSSRRRKSRKPSPSSVVKNKNLDRETISMNKNNAEKYLEQVQDSDNEDRNTQKQKPKPKAGPKCYKESLKRSNPDSGNEESSRKRKRSSNDQDKEEEQQDVKPFTGVVGNSSNDEDLYFTNIIKTLQNQESFKCFICRKTSTVKNFYINVKDGELKCMNCLMVAAKKEHEREIQILKNEAEKLKAKKEKAEKESKEKLEKMEKEMNRMRKKIEELGSSSGSSNNKKKTVVKEVSFPNKNVNEIRERIQVLESLLDSNEEVNDSTDDDDDSDS